METISILCQSELTEKDLFDFVDEEGGHPISGQFGGFCIERGAPAVFLSIEAERFRDWARIKDRHPKLSTAIKTVLLITMSRQEGTEFLCFEIATKIANRWNGVIDWEGLACYPEFYKRWLDNQKTSLS